MFVRGIAVFAAACGVCVALLADPVVGVSLIAFGAVFPWTASRLRPGPARRPADSRELPSGGLATDELAGPTGWTAPTTTAAEEYWRKRHDSPLPTQAVLTQEQEAVQALAEKRCLRVWEDISKGRYFDGDDGGLNHAAIWADIEEAVGDVAEVYGKPRERAFMTARVADITVGIRSISSELLDIARSIPVIDLGTWTPDEVVRSLRRGAVAIGVAEKGAAAYRYAKPLVYGARVAFLGANAPLMIGMWVADELTRTLQTRALNWTKQQAQQWAVGSLVNQAVATIYRQAALLHRPGGQRTLDWYVLAETCAIHQAIPGSDANRRLLLEGVLEAPIFDEYERLDLLRAVAKDRAPRLLALTDSTYESHSASEREAVARGLEGVLRGMQGLSSPEARAAIAAAGARLDHSVSVNFGASGALFDEAAAAAVGLVHEVSRHALGMDLEGARTAFSGSDLDKLVRKQLGAEAANLYQRTEAAIAAKRGTEPMVPPLGLAGSDISEPLTELLGELLGGPRSARTFDADRLFRKLMLSLIPEPKRRAKAWRRYEKVTRSTLKELVLSQGGVSVPDGGAARACLRTVRGGDRPILVAAVDRARERNAGWIAVYPDRLCVGRLPREDHPLDTSFTEWPMAQVSTFKEKGRLNHGLILRRSADGSQSVLDEVRIPNKVPGRFRRLFGEALTSLGQAGGPLPSARFGEVLEEA